MTNRTKAQFRRATWLGMLALATAPGCASLKNPFAKSSLADPPKFASSVATTSSGITGQFKSMGSAVGSAMGKAKNAVTSTFTSASGEAGDPTSLASMPTNLGPEIWVADGQIHESKGNNAKALDKYTKALELEPTNLPALLSTARLYAKQEQPAQAAMFFEKAIAVNPDPSIYNELALIQQKAGKTADAQIAVRRAIELDPSNEKYRNNLATLLVAGGRSDEAVAQLQQVFPPAVANYNVAYLHFNQGNIPAAQQHLQLALQADPNLQPARDLIATIGGSQTAQTAMNAYNTAGSVYRTAQAISAPTTQATQVPYQQP
ncbi:MAG: tetratricopeptide repeat protein [Pirellulaceae bacterium]